MASRRTRIKGVANIPQRRKTVNSDNNAEEQPQIKEEIEKVEDVKPNLTSHHVPQNEEKKEAFLDKSEVNEDTNAISDQKITEDSGNIVSNVITDNVKSEPTPKLTATIPRRKFIKPTVSLSAIRRKSKDVDDANKQNQNVQKSQKNNKIVILNEVITYPNQEQHIVINNYQHAANNVKEEQIVQKKTQDSPGNSSSCIVSLPCNSDEPQQAETGHPLPKRDLIRSFPERAIINSDREYPVLPASPSKLNRSRIKAIPRLSQRNTSFSASESEDESRRNYRHRNDSVCSTASGIGDSSVGECPSPQKPKEFNSVIQRKCRRTEQSRKLAEARRDFYMKFGNKKPDRQKLTMIDLIFYNPTTNLMNHEDKKRDDPTPDVDKDDPTPDVDGREDEEKVEDPAKSGSDEENEVPAPQIKIGPQGEIVVDEQSLVIESRSVKRGREELEKQQVVNGDFDTGYGVYKRAKRSKDWSKRETLKFYKALNTIGTDFTLMCELFPRRSRRELKMKFKKEEKINKALIDKAIMQPCGFDFNDFKHEVDMEEKELMELEKMKEREQQMKKESKKRKASLSLKTDPKKVAKVAEKPKEKKKKKPLDIMNVLDDNSDADESEMESVFDEDDDNDDAQERLLQTIQKPTRSGRIPKILSRYRPIENRPVRTEPGSLIVVASTGSNGGPVYKVCMVTPEQDRQQIGENMDSLSKALECKQNHNLENLFTITATPTTIVEECNVTIPAEENNDTNVTVNEEYNFAVPIDEEINITIPADEDINITNVFKEEIVE